MADQAYNIFRRLMGSATAQPPGIDYIADDIRWYGIDTNQYSFDITHNYLSSIPVGARICSGLLQNKSIEANGAWNADPLVIPQVEAGKTITAWVMVKDTGNVSTSPVLCKFDTYANTPVGTNGGDVTITFPTDSNKILRP